MTVAGNSAGVPSLPLAGGAIAHVYGGRRCFHAVMAGLVPAIHELSRGAKNVDARDKPGHDEFVAAPAIIPA